MSDSISQVPAGGDERIASSCLLILDFCAFCSAKGCDLRIVPGVMMRIFGHPMNVPSTKAQLMVVIEGKQKEAAATEEVVSKAPTSPAKQGGLKGHDSDHQTWGSHV